MGIAVRVRAGLQSHGYSGEGEGWDFSHMGIAVRVRAALQSHGYGGEGEGGTSVTWV
jgi:hypothetical protein